MERALSLFDTALQEWADYISFLGRLLKVSDAPEIDLEVVTYVDFSNKLRPCKLVPQTLP